MTVKEVFFSQGNPLLETASGLQETSLNKTRCEKVNSGQLPLLPATATQDEEAL